MGWRPWATTSCNRGPPTSMVRAARSRSSKTGSPSTSRRLAGPTSSMPRSRVSSAPNQRYELHPRESTSFHLKTSSVDHRRDARPQGGSKLRRHDGRSHKSERRCENQAQEDEQQLPASFGSRIRSCAIASPAGRQRLDRPERPERGRRLDCVGSGIVSASFNKIEHVFSALKSCRAGEHRQPERSWTTRQSYRGERQALTMSRSRSAVELSVAKNPSR